MVRGEELYRRNSRNEGGKVEDRAERHRGESKEERRSVAGVAASRWRERAQEV